MTLKISVVILAKNAIASTAEIVKTAKGISPRKKETTAIAETVEINAASWMPIRFATMAASVCSPQVKGSQ